jgi:hypothetical protein
VQLTVRFSPLLASVSLLVAGFAAPVAAAQTQICPIVADTDVSRAVGSPVQVSPFMVVDSGSAIQCLFDGSAVGDGVLVGRYPSFFGSDPVLPFSPDQTSLRFLLPDGLTAGSVLTVTPVDGLGDAAAWVVPADPTTAPDSLGRLLVRRGADAFVIGIDTVIGANALDTATSVARTVLAGST